MFNIINLEPSFYSDEARKLLSKDWNYSEYSEGDDFAALLVDADVVITRLTYSIDKEFVAKLPKLKVLVSATTGLDHIDLAYLDQRNIELLSLRGETEFLNTITATAELTWGLLLALVRQISAAFMDVKSGKWRREPFRGIELKGKVLGVVGYGRLGRMVAKYGKAFGMNVMAYDPFVSPDDSINLVSFNELLQQSDIVSLHVPYDNNIGFFDKNVFSMMKKGAILLNTSRGQIIDEGALLSVLQNNHLSGAALDVLASEEIMREGKENWPLSDPLLQYADKNKNLIIVPHIGGWTTDSAHATELFMANKLINHLNNNV